MTPMSEEGFPRRLGAEEPGGSPGPAQSDNGEITPEVVVDAIRPIVDPEIGISIVDLGLVYDVEVEGETVRVTYTLTSMGCPVGPLIDQQIQAFVGALPGVSAVDTRIVFTPPWSPEKMSEDAKAALGMF